jgi:hypothetical protein
MAVQELLSTIWLFPEHTWLCHIRITTELVHFVSHSILTFLKLKTPNYN